MQLRRVLEASALAGAPVLVVANKADLPFSKTAVDIEKALSCPVQHGYEFQNLCAYNWVMKTLLSMLN